VPEAQNRRGGRSKSAHIGLPDWRSTNARRPLVTPQRERAKGGSRAGNEGRTITRLGLPSAATKECVLSGASRKKRAQPARKPEAAGQEPWRRYLVVETPATIAACKRIHEHQQFVWGFIRVFIDFHGLYKRCLRGECRRAGGCRGAAMDDSCYREVEPYLTEHVYPEIREALRNRREAMLSRKRRRDHDPGRYWRLDL